MAMAKDYSYSYGKGNGNGKGNGKGSGNGFGYTNRKGQGQPQHISQAPNCRLPRMLTLSARNVPIHLTKKHGQLSLSSHIAAIIMTNDPSSLSLVLSSPAQVLCRPSSFMSHLSAPVSCWLLLVHQRCGHRCSVSASR